MAALHFDYVPEEEINSLIKESATPRNTKHATKFERHSSKVRCENYAKCNLETNIHFAFGEKLLNIYLQLVCRV